jgi:hypothetical protein
VLAFAWSIAGKNPAAAAASESYDSKPLALPARISR